MKQLANPDHINIHYYELEINNLMVMSASRELAPCCRALLKDIMVFSGAN